MISTTNRTDITASRFSGICFFSTTVSHSPINNAAIAAIDKGIKTRKPIPPAMPEFIGIRLVIAARRMTTPQKRKLP